MCFNVAMRALTISDASVMVLGLQDEIRRNEESRYDHRLHGVLLVAQGMNCCRVAELLGDSPRTVEYWVRRFEEKGLAGLQEKGRPGRPSRLNAQQIAEIQAALRKRPADFGLSGNLWDGKTLAAHIENTYGIRLGARQCRRFFRQWRFRLVKPRPLIARADPVKQAEHKKTPRDKCRL
jgi:transposase